jgi:hypothetical protein
MNATNIEEMVRILSGSFPNADIFKPDVIKAWERNDVIARMSVEEGRAVQKLLVNTLTQFPSVSDVIQAHGKLFSNKANECKHCSGSGWVYPRDENGEPIKFKSKITALQKVDYIGVVACKDCNN